MRLRWTPRGRGAHPAVPHAGEGAGGVCGAVRLDLGDSVRVVGGQLDFVDAAIVIEEEERPAGRVPGRDSVDDGLVEGVGSFVLRSEPVPRPVDVLADLRVHPTVQSPRSRRRTRGEDPKTSMSRPCRLPT